MIRFYFLVILFGAFLPSVSAQGLFKCDNGEIYFKSDAPLEIIEARSKSLKGAIDLELRTFAFTIEIPTFEGFNSPLQRVHFNENYMESDDIFTASFHGKIIEKSVLPKGEKVVIRAKGKLNIHGVTQERIIKATVELNKKKLSVSSFFTVLLSEHDIAIPKIVTQKIAEEIQVFVEAEFLKK